MNSKALGKVIRNPIIIPETDDESENEISSPDMFDDLDDALSRQASSLSLSHSSQRISNVTSFPSYDPDQEIDSVSSAEELIFDLPTSQPSHDQISDPGPSSSSSYMIEDVSSISSRAIHVTTSYSDDEGDNAADVDDDDGNDDDREKRTRNKRPQPHTWKQNKRRYNRNHGLEYMSAQGVVQPAKRMLSSCHCQQNCELLFDEADRQTIFDEFWMLGDINRQRELLNKLVITEIIDNNTRRR